MFVGNVGATLERCHVSGGGETDVGSTTATGVTLTLVWHLITGGNWYSPTVRDTVFVGTSARH